MKKALAKNYLFFKATHRDIVCFFHFKCGGLSHKEIARIEHLTLNQVASSISKINKIISVHEDKIASLMEVFVLH